MFFLFGLLLMAAVHFLFPITLLVHFPVNLYGLVPLAIGVWLNLRSDQLFKRDRTTVKPFERPTSLITRGPYAVSRHPMYSGMASVLFGIAFLFGSVLVFIFPLLFILLVDLLFIHHEEKTLAAVFGDTYQIYRKKVRRWL